MMQRRAFIMYPAVIMILRSVGGLALNLILIIGAVGGSHYAKHKKNLTPRDGWNYWEYVVGFGLLDRVLKHNTSGGLRC